MGFDREYDYTELSREYDEYELLPEERRSCEQIALSLQKKPSQQALRSQLNYLEHLEVKIRGILRNETSIGYENETLKHDYQKIKRLIQRVRAELDAVDY